MKEDVRYLIGVQYIFDWRLINRREERVTPRIKGKRKRKPGTGWLERGLGAGGQDYEMGLTGVYNLAISLVRL